MTRRFAFFSALALLLAACDVWNTQPQPLSARTAIPSRVPEIVTATPLIFSPTAIILTPVTPNATFTPTPTETSTLTFTPVPPSKIAASAPAQSFDMQILGCDTSIDITHGMGEVTNAYVILQNTGSVDLPNTCALLRAIDEGREHPDKKVCVPNLPARNQATLKLTVDSTYKESTIIQVDAFSNDAILLRLDQQSCTDIGLFGGAPGNLGNIAPIP